jgi:energy-coupling factor transporter ATP-binding protein EcfA2
LQRRVAEQRRLNQRLAAVTQRREELRAPLRIAIIGGTGVGKSSLLNALAGERVAEASAVRPTTQRVTTYVHEANAAAVPPQLAAVIARHRRDALRDKILIDTPDLDSTDRRHWDLMAAALEAADLVLWVTTAEKYADLADAGWLRRYRGGRRWVVVLNRADEGLPAAVRSDLRRRLIELGLAGEANYAVSATEAGAGRPNDDFVALQAMIETELDARQIAALKRENLEAALAEVVAACAAAVPVDLGRRLETWRAEQEAGWEDLRAAIGPRLTARLAADPRLARHVEYWLSFGFGGPIGLILAAAYGSRAVFSPLYPRLWEVSEGPPVEAVGEAEAEALATRLAALSETGAARLTALDLPAAGPSTPDPAALRAAAGGLDQHLRADLGRQLSAAREACPLGLRLVALALNVPTLVLAVGGPLLALVLRWRAFAEESTLALPPWRLCALTFALWLVLAAAVGQGAVRVAARRWRRRLGTAVDSALEQVLGRRRRERAAELSAELTADLAALAALSSQPHANNT